MILILTDGFANALTLPSKQFQTSISDQRPLAVKMSPPLMLHESNDGQYTPLFKAVFNRLRLCADRTEF